MATLFEDVFEVKDIDPDGKKFDKGLLFYLALGLFGLIQFT